MATPHLHQGAELDCASTDTNSPTMGESVRIMCSFGGKILPRPHDNQLRYVGGDTRIVSFPRRSTSFAALLARLSRLARTGGGTNDNNNNNRDTTTDIAVKYQLPNEDLDALITLASDEDLENMMDEHDRNPGSRLRLFLFTNDPVSRTSSISSLLDGSTKRENWFLDALNGGPGSGLRSALERGRSEASSMLSEVPDYLFGLDSTDDQPKSKLNKPKFDTVMDTVSNSDPGSPAPVINSPYCSASSSIPDLTPVKVRPDAYQVDSFVPVEPPLRQYVPEGPYQSPGVQHIPVYYVPGSNIPVQIRGAYGQMYQPMPGQPPAGYNGQQVYQQHIPNRVINSDNMNPHVYYRNPYNGMVVPGRDDVAVMGTEVRLERVNQPR